MRRDDDEVTFEIVFDASEGVVLTVSIEVPSGSILLMGEIREEGRTLLASRVHIAVDGPTGMLTRKTMQTIARRVLKDMGYDEIIVEGAARTTGARPGHRPRRFRFR